MLEKKEQTTEQTKEQAHACHDSSADKCPTREYRCCCILVSAGCGGACSCSAACTQMEQCLARQVAIGMDDSQQPLLVSPAKRHSGRHSASSQADCRWFSQGHAALQVGDHDWRAPAKQGHSCHTAMRNANASPPETPELPHAEEAAEAAELELELPSRMRASSRRRPEEPPAADAAAAATAAPQPADGRHSRWNGRWRLRTLRQQCSLCSGATFRRDG